MKPRTLLILGLMFGTAIASLVFVLRFQSGIEEGTGSQSSGIDQIPGVLPPVSRATVVGHQSYVPVGAGIVSEDADTTGMGPGDILQALAEAEQISDDKERQRKLIQILLQWGKKNPLAALAWLDERPADRQMNFVRVQLLGSLAVTNLTRALELAEAFDAGDQDMKALALRTILTNAASKNPEEVLRLCQEKFAGADWVASVQAAAIVMLAQSDPNRALSLVGEMPAGPMRAQLLQNTLSLWAAADPAAVAGYLQQLPDGGERLRLTTQVAMQLAQLNPEQAVTLLQQIPESRPGENRQAVEQVARLWSAKEPQRAADFLFDYAKSTPASAAALNNLLREWMWSDPSAKAGCVQWITAQSRNLPSELLDVFVERLGRADVQAAINFANSLGNDTRAQSAQWVAYQMGIRETARTDGARAAAMIENSAYPPDEVVYAELLHNWSQQDPASAAAWIESRAASEKNKLSRGYYEVYAAYRAVDPAAADAWQKRVEQNMAAKQ